MASYTESFNSTNWGKSLERAFAGPVDRSSMFASYSDAVKYALGDGSDSRGFGATSYIGQILTVYENDNVKVYVISSDRTLEEVGSSSIQVNDFEEALTYANSDNTGRIVYIASKTYAYTESGETVYTTEKPDDSVEYTTYDSGAYIVAGNTLQKLAQSSASGDIEGDITAIETRLTDVENGIYLSGDDLK